MLNPLLALTAPPLAVPPNPPPRPQALLRLRADGVRAGKFTTNFPASEYYNDKGELLPAPYIDERLSDL